MLSYLVLQFVVMVNPELPFSLPMDKDTRSGKMFGVMMVVTIVGIFSYIFLVNVIYRSTTAMVEAAFALALVAYVMDRITRRRAGGWP